jgi:GT2 family glycosyltransferase
MQKSLEVSWLSGCCMLFKKEALDQVGGLNSSLRFYNEDMEWCWRFRKAGWHCRLVNTPVTHLGGSSTPKDLRFLIEGYRGGFLLSRWYKPKVYRYAHKAIVRLESRWNAARNSSEFAKKGYQQIGKLFRLNQFDTSPFGETLEQENKAFETEQNSHYA